jgi:hypothetical protein
MRARGKLESGVLEMADPESLALQNHLLRKIDTAGDWERLYAIVELLPGEAPVYLLQGLYQNGTAAHLEGLRGDGRRVRYTPEYRSLYERRREIADVKKKHAMYDTQYTGLAQVTNWVKLKFSAMNLKKLAK